MRIRKHAKISPLNYASSVFLRQHGAVLQPHVCKLNQSPWDVITFPIEDNHRNYQLFSPPPPPPLLVAPLSSYKLDGYGSCAVNGTFCDFEQSIKSMKKLDDNREMNFSENNVADVPADFKKAEKDDGVNNNRSLCCKNDGKAWKCNREAKRGHSLCEHHFAQLKRHHSNNDSAQCSTITNIVVASSGDTKNKQTVVLDVAAEMTRSSRGRPHRPKKSSSSDFYYYSSFGPLWAKKRDASTGKKNNATVAATEITLAENYSSHDNTAHGRTQSSSSQMGNEGFEYIKDEDDHDEVENSKLMKKARKRIKARSLKSLV